MGRLDAWRNGGSAGPLRVTLFPTNRCNLRCSICWQRWADVGLFPVGPQLVPTQKINAIQPDSTSPAALPPSNNHPRLEAEALWTRTFAWQSGHSSYCPASEDGLSSSARHFGHLYCTILHSPWHLVRYASETSRLSSRAIPSARTFRTLVRYPVVGCAAAVGCTPRQRRNGVQAIHRACTPYTAPLAWSVARRAVNTPAPGGRRCLVARGRRRGRS